MSNPTANPTAFALLDVRTPYGPGGGPGLPADYVRAAQGATALACTDYGSVAAWPGWAAACHAADIRPIFGLACDLTATGGDPWPLILLAATSAGLRHLITLHNRLTRTSDGRCLLDVPTLTAQAAGLWLILAPAGEQEPTPLLALPPAEAVAAVARLRAALPHPAALLCGLPTDRAAQTAVAELAAACALPLLALPAVRYPPSSAELRAYSDPSAPTAVSAGHKTPPSALALALAVAESCEATLADLGAGELDGAAHKAALDAAVATARPTATWASDRLIAAEVAALAGTGWAGGVLAATRVVTAAQQLGLPLGAPAGVIAEGQVPALLGLCPVSPWPVPPRWSQAGAADPAWTPLLTVPAGRRAALLAGLAATAAGLVPVRSAVPRGPAAALAGVIGPLDLPAPIWAALEAALLEAQSAARTGRWRAALPDLPAAAAAALLATVLAWAAAPGPPQADGEALLVMPTVAALPLLPAAGGGVIVAWTAAECAALGLPLLLLRGDSALDRWDRALALAAGPPPLLPADDLRLALTAGDLAGLPLPPIGDEAALEPARDGLAAFCAALLPGDPADALGWAALGALLYGPAGLHPWLKTYLRRHIGGAAVSYHYPSLAPVLELTSGLPLFCEQVTLLRLLISSDDSVPPAGRLQLEEWLDQAARLATGYTAALVAAEGLHLALRLKAAKPAAVLAAGLESALIAGDADELGTLLREAQRHGLGLLPPDLDRSAAGFGLETPPAPAPAEGTRRAAAAPPAVRWGLAWSRAMQPWAAALVAARTALPAGRVAALADLCAVARDHGLPAAYLAGLIRSGACDRLGSRSALLAALPGAIAAAASAAPPADPPAAPVGADSPLLWRIWEAHLLGYAFTPPEGSAAILRPGAARGVARLTLAALGPDQVGQTVTVTVVPGAVRLVALDGAADPLAVALVQDAAGALPLVLFPPEWARFGPLLVADTPVIVTARVQRAEGGAGQGAGVVLIGERLLPYAAPREEQELNMTVRKPRAVSEQLAKPAPNPLEYSASGQRYSRAPRPAYSAADSVDAGADPVDPALVREASGTPHAAAPAPPCAGADSGRAEPPPAQIVITLHSLATEDEDEARMRQLKAILVRYPGPTGVLLFFPDDPLVGMPTYLPLKRTVTPDAAFCADVDALLGAGCYEMREK